MFLKWIKVPYPVFASSRPWKKTGSGGEGKVHMSPLNNFSDFFLIKKNFCDFERGETIKFSKQF